MPIADDQAINAIAKQYGFSSGQNTDASAGSVSNTGGSQTTTSTDDSSATGTSQSVGSGSSEGNQTATTPITGGDQPSAFTAQMSQIAGNMYYLGQAGVQGTAALADQFLIQPFAYAGGALGGVATTIGNGTFGTQQGVQQAEQSAFDTANLYSYQPSNALAQSNLATINALMAEVTGPLLSAQPMLGEYAASDASAGAYGTNINEMATEANSINAQMAQNGQYIGDQPYIAPTNTTGGFQTHGITVDQVPLAIQNQLESDLQAGGASNPTASMEQIVQSGSTVPVPIQATASTTLYKLVSTSSDYSEPSPSTAFWLDQTQLNLIQAHPELANDILGLPSNSQAASFNVFEIQPEPNTTPIIYQSQVATTTEATGNTSVGNATQTIVPNRSLWTTPKLTGITINAN